MGKAKERKQFKKAFITELTQINQPIPCSLSEKILNPKDFKIVQHLTLDTILFTKNTTIIKSYNWNLINSIRYRI